MEIIAIRTTFEITIVYLRLELENEVKLRLSGLAAGGTISLTFSYVGVFAGATKPKPFQRKQGRQLVGPVDSVTQ